MNNGYVYLYSVLDKHVPHSERFSAAPFSDA
jgi:hypothetical protein